MSEERGARSLSEAQVGDVVRLNEFPFADCTVLAVRTDDFAKRWLKVSRPYVYATETGGALVGTEQFEFCVRAGPHDLAVVIDTGRVMR